MDNVFQQYKEILKKSLPQHVGEILQAELEELDRLRKRVKELDDKTIKMVNEIQDLKNLKLDAKKLDTEWADFAKEREKFKEEKRNLKIEKLEHQLGCEKDKVNFSRELLRGIIRNTTIRKSILDSETSGQPVTDAKGYVHYPSPSSKHHETTETQE